MWDRIDKRMRQLGLRDADLARALGVTSQHVSNWRRRGLPPSRFAEIAQALGKPAGWLLSEDDKSFSGLKPEARRQLLELTNLFIQLDENDRTRLVDIAQVIADKPRLEH